MSQNNVAESLFQSTNATPFNDYNYDASSEDSLDINTDLFTRVAEQCELSAIELERDAKKFFQKHSTFYSNSPPPFDITLTLQVLSDVLSRPIHIFESESGLKGTYRSIEPSSLAQKVFEIPIYLSEKDLVVASLDARSSLSLAPPKKKRVNISNDTQEFGGTDDVTEKIHDIFAHQRELVKEGSRSSLIVSGCASIDEGVWEEIKDDPIVNQNRIEIDSTHLTKKVISQSYSPRVSKRESKPRNDPEFIPRSFLTADKGSMDSDEFQQMQEALELSMIENFAPASTANDEPTLEERELQMAIQLSLESAPRPPQPSRKGKERVFI